jgi:membrane associated rhomboid family serine protease
MEYLSNRAHLAMVFLLSIISGGIFSIFFLPESTSVGASGGIMGLIGYLAIYGYRRRRQLPPDFLKTMLINIGFIAAFGLIAYEFVDNFAHLGGFVAGSVYGFFQIPGNSSSDPRSAGKMVELTGILSVAVFIAESVFTIFRIFGKA